MLVTVKPVAPIRGVTRNVILTEQTLDLNLFQIKKCMRFGSVSYNNVLLTSKNVDDIFNNGIKEEVVEEAKEEKVTIKEEPVEEVPVEESVETEKEVVEEVKDETPSQQTNSKSTKNKNRNNK